MINRFLITLFLLYMSLSCTSEIEIVRPDEFVKIKNNKFELNGNHFFPIMINYVVCLREIENEIVVSCIKEYENPGTFEASSIKENNYQLKAHLQLIKDMGFNSIRLVIDRVYNDHLGYFYPIDHNRKLYLKKDYNEIIGAFEKYISLIKTFDLKVMILIKAPISNKELENFSIKILKKFHEEPTIFAYDFFNEPLYFDIDFKTSKHNNRRKKEAYNIVKKWKRLIQKYSPNQLLTIGFSEPIEVFEWDPSIMPVDFISFHTYNPLRVPNEIYWYSKYIDKPWMIGETALPADGDSISYAEQKQFLIDVYKKVVSCGGAGLGWWEFQEIPFTHFEAQYTGLLNNKGFTYTNNGNYKIIGSLKPAALEIKNLRNIKVTENSEPAVNYYNMMGYNNYLIKGKVINGFDNSPIEGAVIRGWNENWSIGLNTFTNELGEFTLYSNDECTHFEVSAPKMTKIKFDAKIKFKSTDKISIENLTDRKLEYHSISYKPFLRTNVNDSLFSIFDFDSSKFNKAKLVGSMNTIKLFRIDNCTN